MTFFNWLLKSSIWLHKKEIGEVLIEVGKTTVLLSAVSAIIFSRMPSPFLVIVSFGFVVGGLTICVVGKVIEDFC